MISPNKISYLRNTPGETIVQEHADFTRRQFATGGRPVVIAARNEEGDLPATLLALADSRDHVTPIVVENGSDDRTYEFAISMGAQALTGASHKMDALQAGVSYAIEEGMGRSVLFTDADTLVGPNWSTELDPGDDPASDASRLRYGSVAFTHGSARHVDLVRSGYAFARDMSTLVQNKPPVGRGLNMSMRFSESDGLYEEYMGLPPDLFVAEEEKFTDMVIQRNGLITRALSMRALVVSRGDRYDSLGALMKVLGPNKFDARIELYKGDYGDFTPMRG